MVWFCRVWYDVMVLYKKPPSYQEETLHPHCIRRLYVSYYSVCRAANLAFYQIPRYAIGGYDYGSYSQGPYLNHVQRISSSGGAWETRASFPRFISDHFRAFNLGRI